MADDETPNIVENEKFSKSWPKIKLDLNLDATTLKFLTEPPDVSTAEWLVMPKYAVKDAEFTSQYYQQYYSQAEPEWIAPNPSFYQGFKPNQYAFVPCGDASCMLCSLTSQYEPVKPPNFIPGEDDVPPATPLLNSIPDLQKRVACPCKDKCVGIGGPKEIWQMVIHLNDKEGWTREQIADWLETLDADLQFKLPESPEITEGEDV